MIKLKIIKVDEEFDYYLIDNTNKKYHLNMEFYGLDNRPKVNDYIYLSKILLDENNLYNFGVIDGQYSKNVDVNEKEIIKIVSGDREYYLQRYYG